MDRYYTSLANGLYRGYFICWRKHPNSTFARGAEFDIVGQGTVIVPRAAMRVLASDGDIAPGSEVSLEFGPAMLRQIKAVRDAKGQPKSVLCREVEVRPAPVLRRRP